MENMSEFRAARCPCGKVQNGTKLPSEKDQPSNYKLNCCLAINPTDEGIKTVLHYDRQCQTRGVKNLLPPAECDIWEAPSVKYQRRDRDRERESRSTRTTSPARTQLCSRTSLSGSTRHSARRGII